MLNVDVNGVDEREQKIAYVRMDRLFMASRRFSLLPWTDNRGTKPVSGDRRASSRPVSQGDRLSQASDPAGGRMALADGMHLAAGLDRQPSASSRQRGYRRRSARARRQGFLASIAADLVLRAALGARQLGAS